MLGLTVLQLGPLERPSAVRVGCDSGNGLQKEGCHEKCVKHRLGGSVRGQINSQPLIERENSVTHQLPGKAGSVSSPLYLPTRPKGTPCFILLGQHDSGVLHTVNHLSQSNACAGQTEPKGRHAVLEQGLLRGVDAPSTNGSENLGDL